jgi:cytochrome o ubiquinol oxidase subunit 2
LAAVLAAAPALGGCQWALFDPAGPIAAEEKSLIILATCLMLVVVVPVIAMILAFAWRYRVSNTGAAYTPDWEHSNRIELVVWLAPCCIIAVLGVVTWVSTHKLDPYRPIAANAKPIEVEVVSLDWKWLFIYPDLKIASVNELAMPVGTPVHFRLTSASVMNSFFIPRLGSQIYTMPGMETQLSLLASKPGDYPGLSANYSGGGFSDMHFTAKALNRADFARWVETVRASQGKLTLAAYRGLAQPGVTPKAIAFGDVDPALYHDVLNKCADGALCTDSATNIAMLKTMSGGPAPICDPAKSKRFN